MQVTLSNAHSSTVISIHSFQSSSPGPCQLGPVAAIILFNQTQAAVFIKSVFVPPCSVLFWFLSALTIFYGFKFFLMKFFSDETPVVANHSPIIPKLRHFIFTIKKKDKFRNFQTNWEAFFQLTVELQMWRGLTFQPCPISLMTPGEHCSDSRLTLEGNVPVMPSKTTRCWYPQSQPHRALQ